MSLTTMPAVPCPRKRPAGKKCGVMVPSDVSPDRMMCGTCRQTMSIAAVAALAKARARKPVTVSAEPSEQLLLFSDDDP